MCWEQAEQQTNRAQFKVESSDQNEYKVSQNFATRLKKFFEIFHHIRIQENNTKQFQTQ